MRRRKKNRRMRRNAKEWRNEGRRNEKWERKKENEEKKAGEGRANRSKQGPEVPCSLFPAYHCVDVRKMQWDAELRDLLVLISYPGVLIPATCRALIILNITTSSSCICSSSSQEIARYLSSTSPGLNISISSSETMPNLIHQLSSYEISPQESAPSALPLAYIMGFNGEQFRYEM